MLYSVRYKIRHRIKIQRDLVVVSFTNSNHNQCFKITEISSNVKLSYYNYIMFLGQFSILWYFSSLKHWLWLLLVKWTTTGSRWTLILYTYVWFYKLHCIASSNVHILWPEDCLKQSPKHVARLNKKTTKPIPINHQLDATISPVYHLTFNYSSTCFGRPHAHHQELNNCSTSLWFYLRSVVIAVLLVVVGGRRSVVDRKVVMPRRTVLLSVYISRCKFPGMWRRVFRRAVIDVSKANIAAFIFDPWPRREGHYHYPSKLRELRVQRHSFIPHEARVFSDTALLTWYLTVSRSSASASSFSSNSVFPYVTKTLCLAFQKMCGWYHRVSNRAV